MLFSSNFLLELFPDTKGAVSDHIPINEINTDSRKESPKSLFIPLKGEAFDGHDFIKDAFYNGAIATLWQKDIEIPRFIPNDFPVFLVDDTLVALQQLAHQYRQKVDPIVVGVTGSNGKTTTKDLIGSVLQSHFKTVYTKGNFNNHIGLPLTILSMKPDTEVLILEMGMNHFGEIQLLSEIALPDYAVITNIGESHLEYLGSREGIAQAKTEIFAGMSKHGVVVYDGDEALLRGLESPLTLIGCGFGEENSVIVQRSTMSDNQMNFHLNTGEDYTLNMLGNHNVKNATYAIVIAKQLKVPEDKIKKALLETKLTGMRLEMIPGKNGVVIINDAYNASPTSMRASIEIVKQLPNFETKVLILGDIFELGKDSKKLHQSVADAISDEINVLFTIGKDADEISKAVRGFGYNNTVSHVDSKEQLLELIQPYLREDVVILLKASRGMRLETILNDIK